MLLIPTNEHTKTPKHQKFDHLDEIVEDIDVRQTPSNFKIPGVERDDTTVSTQIDNHQSARFSINRNDDDETTL